MVAAIAKWRTRSGIRRTSPSDTLSVDVEAFCDLNPAGENGVQRVDFSVRQNGGAPTVTSVTAPSLRQPNYSAQNSPLPGVASGMAPLWAYGVTLDCNALAAGSITVTAIVYSTLGTATALPGSVTLYNDKDGTDRRPSTKQIYVSPTGSNTTGDGTIGLPFATIMYALVRCRANPAGSTSADFDCGGAELVLMAGQHSWAGGHFGVASWHTSNEWWLTVTFLAGAEVIRPGITTVVPDHYLTAAGFGAGTTCRIRFVGGFWRGRGGVVNVISGVRCDVWIDGGTSGSTYWDATTKPYSVRFHEDNGAPIGFDGDLSNARTYISCLLRRGCTFGLAAQTDIHDFVIRNFLGVALQSTGTIDGNSAVNGLIDGQRYTAAEVGGYFAYAGGNNLSVTIPAAGQMRIDISGAAMNAATQLAELVGTTYWGVKLTGCTASGNNGTFPILSVGTNGLGTPYIVVANASAVSGAAGSGAAIATGRLSDGLFYTEVIHPDIHQWDSARTETLHSHIACRDIPSAQSWFSSGHNHTRCVLFNVSDGGGGIRANFEGSSLFDCLILNCTFTGPWDFAASGEVFTGTNIVNCVVATTSSMPTTGTYLTHNHFVAGTPAGSSQTTGAWFLGTPSVTPWSLEPLVANLDTGNSAVVTPSAWRWTGGAATNRGVWRNVGAISWGIDATGVCGAWATGTSSAATTVATAGALATVRTWATGNGAAWSTVAANGDVAVAVTVAPGWDAAAGSWAGGIGYTDVVAVVAEWEVVAVDGIPSGEWVSDSLARAGALAEPSAWSDFETGSMPTAVALAGALGSAGSWTTGDASVPSVVATTTPDATSGVWTTGTAAAWSSVAAATDPGATITMPTTGTALAWGSISAAAVGVITPSEPGAGAGFPETRGRFSFVAWLNRRRPFRWLR